MTDTNPPNLAVTDLAGIRLAQLAPESLSYSRVLNGAGALAFEMARTDPKLTLDLLKEGERLVDVHDAAALAWHGSLEAWSASWTEGADVPDPVKVTAADRWARLGSPGRYIDEDFTFTDADQFDIAWALLEWTQAKPNGDLGIVRNPDEVPSGVLRTITYAGTDRQTVADAIANLAASDDGFDFTIDPDGTWRVFQPIKAIDSGAVFKLGKNISGFSYTGDASTIATVVTAIGGPLAVSAASFAGTKITFTAKAHGFSVGDLVSTSGFTPDGYNVSSLAITDTTTDTFKVVADDPGGGATVVGTVTPEAGPPNIMASAGDASSDESARYLLREQALTYSDVADHATLDGIAAAQLAALSSPAEQPTIAVLASDPDAALETFELGSLVRVILPGAFPQIDDLFRVVTLTITWTEAGQREVSVGFDKRTGVRWVPRLHPVARIFDLNRRLGILERR